MHRRLVDTNRAIVGSCVETTLVVQNRQSCDVLVVALSSFSQQIQNAGELSCWVTHHQHGCLKPHPTFCTACPCATLSTKGHFPHPQLNSQSSLLWPNNFLHLKYVAKMTFDVCCTYSDDLAHFAWVWIQIADVTRQGHCHQMFVLPQAAKLLVIDGCTQLKLTMKKSEIEERQRGKYSPVENLRAAHLLWLNIWCLLDNRACLHIPQLARFVSRCCQQLPAVRTPWALWKEPNRQTTKTKPEEYIISGYNIITLEPKKGHMHYQSTSNTSSNKMNNIFVKQLTDNSGINTNAICTRLATTVHCYVQQANSWMHKLRCFPGCTS